MNENNNPPSVEVLVAEATLKLTAIERLLIKKNVFTANELIDELKLISQEIIEHLKKQNPDQAQMLEDFYQNKTNN